MSRFRSIWTFWFRWELLFRWRFVFRGRLLFWWRLLFGWTPLSWRSSLSLFFFWLNIFRLIYRDYLFLTSCLYFTSWLLRFFNRWWRFLYFLNRRWRPFSLLLYLWYWCLFSCGSLFSWCLFSRSLLGGCFPALLLWFPANLLLLFFIRLSRFINIPHHILFLFEFRNILFLLIIRFLLLFNIFHSIIILFIPYNYTHLWLFLLLFPLILFLNRLNINLFLLLCWWFLGWRLSSGWFFRAGLLLSNLFLRWGWGFLFHGRSSWRLLWCLISWWGHSGWWLFSLFLHFIWSLLVLFMWLILVS